MRFSPLLATCFLLLGQMSLSADDGNRLAYLNDFCNPYYAHRTFPKLVTPQWVGEAGVEAVVTLGIDDMREVDKYETYLRPILERLKKIDGRAAVSIMTCSIDPAHPHLQTWLKEGVSLETHTADHPCPCLQGGDFDKAKSTYDRCVDQISAIPNNRPVAFRFPCCDSQNTPSPRAFAEIINRTTPGGNYLQLSTSVSAMLTADDPDLPRELVLDRDGKPRFSRYVPFPSFVNKVENYPYPFVIDRLCWEFPTAVPDDWQGFHLQQANNPKTLEDMKATLDATVIKRGVHNFVFHPHGWIRNDQMVDFIDHAVEQHGGKVKFLNFRECIDRLNKHLLAGQPLRDEHGGDNGVRILDLNNDGYLDVVIGNEQLQRTRIWLPKENRWQESDFPTRIVDLNANGTHVDAGVRFGVLAGPGTTSLIVRNEKTAGVWHFDGKNWQEDKQSLAGLAIDGQPIFTARAGVDQGVRLRDLDGDGRCEVIVSNPQQQTVFAWQNEEKSWRRLPFSLPEEAVIVDAQGGDQGLRLMDIDEDGHDDLLLSNERRFGLYLWESLEKGWAREVRAGRRGDGSDAIPMISRSGTNNGAWFAARHLWIQNEDTHKLPDGVDRRSFADLLGGKPARPRSIEASLRSIELPEGFTAQLVAAEPLVMDPVAFDWGPDGRLWVVEMADYPLGVDGQSKPGGRVRWLEDVDQDGVYDRSTLFLDNLSTPNGIMAWRNGVLITAAPDVLYAEDTTGDGKADRVEVLFTGFGKGNQQHRVNGLSWGLDNWVYLANGDSGGVVVSKKTGAKVDIRGRDIRIRPDQGLIEPVAGQSQFGRSRDDWGNWFGSNNPNPVFHYVLDDHYLQRNPHFSPPASRRDAREGSTLVYPISPNISHCDPKHRPLGSPSIFTSCNSTIVYRDDLFGPDYAQSTFTSEPVYNLIHRRLLLPEGVTFRSVRPDDMQTTEFFRSSDPWCRPTSLRVGPDGALYVADMVREVIEHPEWINDELEKQIDVRAGHDRGRIYRIAPVGVPRRSVPRLDTLGTAELVAALASPSGWQRDLAHRMLVWRGDEAAIEPLQQLLRKHPDPRTRLQALCVLEGLGTMPPASLAQGLKDADPRVRTRALRIGEAQLAGTNTVFAPVLDEGADVPLLQMQLACSLGESEDAAWSGKRLGQLALQNASDPYLKAAVMSSLHADNIEYVLAEVLDATGDEVVKRSLVDQLLAVAIGLQQKAAVSRAFASLSVATDNGYSDGQLASLARLLTVLESRKETPEKLLDAPLRERIDGMVAQARATVADPSLPVSRRAVAVRLLGRDAAHADADLQQLTALLAPQHPPELQRAAVEALALLSNPRIPALLLADWNQFSPAVRAGALDLLLGRQAGTLALIAGLESGQVSPSQIDAARRDRLLHHKETSIRTAAGKVFSQPTSSDRKDVIEQHRAALALDADPARGKVVFGKRCAACHQLEGVGSQVGPSLLAIKDRTPEAMLIAILDPNRAVEEKFLAYSVITTDGRILSGVIAEESGNQISLRDASGKQLDILRNQIEELRVTTRSLMPEGLEKDVPDQELADLIEYLVTVKEAAPGE
ncbi:PVC-type heme-binding CxxCH protein [Lignipirellula cremea]|uniref:Cytochrome c n=1 Tax=Lignipirellula cremea TaxID=2528010 RepID=A0A518E4K6_9BACT|nr:PVC-type heme-binding CxxCH protein [Lignipirellula cremea]QDU99012.1 Cytochrome c [Lignipirellula cremea]